MQAAFRAEFKPSEEALPASPGGGEVGARARGARGPPGRRRPSGSRAPRAGPGRAGDHRLGGRSRLSVMPAATPRRLAARKAEEARMEVAEKEVRVTVDLFPSADFCLLADEKFDFDLSLSSSSANEDDEVFFGPVGHKERCIAASIEFSEQPALPAAARPCAWSPLTGEKFVEVYKEAHLLALQIESRTRREAAQPTRPEAPGGQDTERFIQESELKINLFDRVQEVEKSPKSLKRETYFLLESPSRAQPCSGEPLLPACSPALPAAPTLGPPHPSRPLTGGPSTVRPPNHAVPPKMTRLQPPRALSGRGKHPQLAVEKPKKETAASPSKVRPGDRAPTAPDAAVPPAGGSQPGPGKRSLPVPNKLGLKRSLLKPPGCAGSLARKPPSSGSVLGLTSNVSVSPAAGRATSGERTGLPSGGSRPRSRTGRLSKASLTMLRPPLPTAPAGPPCGPARNAGVAQGSAEQPEAPTASPLTPSPGLEAGGPRPDPDSAPSTSQRNGTGGLRRPDSCLNAETKAEPTPPRSFQVPKCSLGESPKGVTPKSSRAQRLQSWAAAGRAIIHSTPVRRSLGPAPQGLLGTRTPLSTQRGSALPTPAGRRLSGLPPMTPQPMPTALASPLCRPARRLSSEPRKRSVMRAALAQEVDPKASCGQGGLGPSPPSSVPQALRFSPEKSDFSPESLTEGGARDEAKPGEGSHSGEAVLTDLGLDQLSTAPEEGRPPAALPLVDLGLGQLSTAPEEGRPPAALIDLGLDQLSIAEEGRPPAALPLLDLGLGQLSTAPVEGRPPAALIDLGLDQLSIAEEGRPPAVLPLVDLGLGQLSTAPEEGRPPAALPLLDLGLDQLSAAPEEGRPPAALPLLDLGLDQLSAAPEEGRPPAALPLVDLGLDQLSTAPEEGRPPAALIDLGLDQLSIAEEGRPPAALPLIDLCSTPEMGLGLGLPSRPLVDLMMNSPDMGRSGPVKPPRAEQQQLIDLGSPLIVLSPMADKENMDSPLLKF
ncbi:G2 and S phase-expressed protein 1 [Perognathus longimembris pacificus]|uniref:G2 and S phase-expressed protein 1 n=1 Tax=Perognathus longimembris pacificus TaxID=214514 RepID=UPI0020198CD3|nr:G2 and S phase-expressed protein 1 [Perognathus longimembris pacificus]